MKTNKSYPILRICMAIIALSSLFTSSFAQVTDLEKSLRTVAADTLEGWKKGGVISLNIAQTSLTNWAAGGQNSFALNGLFSAFANLKKGNTTWENSLDVGFGILKQGSEDTHKTDDKFDFVSKYGRKAFGDFYYSGLVNFKTQLAPGYKEPDYENKISDIFAPGYLLAALGLDYKPSPYFSTFLAPITGKITFVADETLSNEGAFGVTPGEKTLTEFGGYFRIVYSRNDFKSDFLKNVSFTTKLDLFSNYAKNPQNIVVNWDVLLALKVNKFLSANITTQLIYDDKIRVPVTEDGVERSVGSLVQFKEILGIGLSLNFSTIIYTCNYEST
jgi:hypothetical protein